jgi:RNA polymerase sigma-54 factor
MTIFDNNYPPIIMLKQHLQQKLLQKLSPQQIQFIKLLQVPTVGLDTRIKEELEENPALEDPSLMTADEPVSEYDDLKDESDDFSEGKEENTDEFNLEDYLQDDNTNDYSTAYNSNDDDEDKKETPIAIESTFFESLQAQLDLIPLSDTDFIIGKQIIGSLDDDGYLRRPINSMIDDLAFSQNVMVEEEDILEILTLVQGFDPAGIAARDLQECLSIQLRRKDINNPIIKKAIAIVEYH